mmetsp:Transcript_76118/g.120193  ORF Transcript_76118/g.120193 Transcript_76118/m.120193 type:complete len:253 (-) Transcript_76118:905-1663(-)
MSFAALFAARFSTKSSCSSFLCFVASATCSSSVTMLSSLALMSASTVFIFCCSSSTAFFKSEMSFSSSFFSSSVLSISSWQYDFLLSSSCCSLFNNVTIPSTISRTLLKLVFLLFNASATKFTRASLPSAGKELSSAFNASPFSCFGEASNCKNEAAAPAGRLFLKRFSARSLFNNFMVSPMASNSCWRVVEAASNSSLLSLHCFDKFASILVLSSRAFSASSNFCLSSTIWTLTLPMRAVLVSMSFCRVLI